MSNTSSNPTEGEKPRRSMFRGQPGTEASRTQVLGLDSLERNLGFFAAFIGFVAAGLALPPYLSGKATKFTQTAKPNAHHLCSKGYHLVSSLCERVVLQTHGYWTFEFYGLLGMAALLLFAAFRKNRAMLIVISLIFGLIAGSAGFLFLALAAWLLIRAFRLQRSGTTQRPARDRTKSRRAPSETNLEAGRAAPAPSKRYTPKRPNRR
jgi:hypothetical protein